MLHDPDVQIARRAAREAGIEPVLDNDVDDRLVHVVVPGHEGVCEADFPVRPFVQVILVHEDVVVDHVVAPRRGEVHVIAFGQFTERGLLVEEVLFVLDDRPAQGVRVHGGIDADLAGKARHFGVDGFGTLHPRDGDAVVPVPDEVDPAYLVQLNGRKNDVLQMGHVHAFPARTQVIGLGQKEFCEIAVPAFAADDQVDGNRPHAPVGFVLRLQDFLHVAE